MHDQMAWEEWVSNAVAVQATSHTLVDTGAQVLKFWAVDPGVVLQRLVVETSGARPSYLGPPETRYIPDRSEHR